MEIRMPFEIFLAGSLSLLIWKLLGYITISYWIVSAPLIFWLLWADAVAVIFIAFWVLFVIVRFLFLTLLLAGMWTFIKVYETWDFLVSKFNPFKKLSKKVGKK